MIVDTFKQLFKRMDHNRFFMDIPPRPSEQLWHWINI